MSDNFIERMSDDFIERISDFIKKSELEVLLSSINVERDGATIYPTNCPGKGRVRNMLTDDNGNPACMVRGESCPYFLNSEFKLEDYTKSIKCGVGDL